jgi:hypothetical protein
MMGLRWVWIGGEDVEEGKEKENECAHRFQISSGYNDYLAQAKYLKSMLLLMFVRLRC